jgi:polyisoprenoid-binding protein YceI
METTMRFGMLFCALPLALRGQAPATFREFRIESAHSLAGFTIGFLGHPVHGRFDDVHGTITYSAGDLAHSSVTVSLPTMSINTGSSHRDEHLRSTDFFDAKSFPAIVFTSNSVQRAGNELVAVGPLTMHGVTREVRIPFRETSPPAVDPHGSTLVYFTGRLKLDRRDFGVAGGSKFNDWFDDLRQRALSDTVDITLEIEGWDTDYDRSSRLSGAIARFVSDGVSKRVSALRALAQAHPDTLRGAEWEIDQTARALLQRGLPADALELFRLNADLFPKSADAKAGMARGLEALRRNGEALAAVDAALAVAPDQTEAIEIRKRLARR